MKSIAVLYAALLCAPNGVVNVYASEEQLQEKGSVRRTKKKGVTKKKAKASTSMEAFVDVAIIGAGFGGLHIADALLHDPLEENKERDSPTVMVLEEKASVGGRAIDIQFDAAPDVWVGMVRETFSKALLELYLLSKIFLRYISHHRDHGELFSINFSDID